uniref:RING-type domain-containing protein n=1 Tax=Chromera velia CCMP2878 TaxID=1169474 RepID=A0A0G4HN83_9ALVE|eukprot:Cvel_7579.t1-p1 / transcript=Cvel_7579.t1 / gene=Cvel_7579 / organism=Chromera_velia_CCMP2878 / gene_product=hypothetical protein / transcript_product=hypothetical protein / location=Cvel_scaffold399:22513-31563(+) / protein_length=2586 / sequence_SO=supercontig / SO=protein_coding / is_pseudo=false
MAAAVVLLPSEDVSFDGETDLFVGAGGEPVSTSFDKALSFRIRAGEEERVREEDGLREGGSVFCIPHCLPSSSSSASNHFGQMERTAVPSSSPASVSSSPVPIQQETAPSYSVGEPRKGFPPFRERLSNQRRPTPSLSLELPVKRPRRGRSPEGRRRPDRRRRKRRSRSRSKSFSESSVERGGSGRAFCVASLACSSSDGLFVAGEEEVGVGGKNQSNSVYLNHFPSSAIATCTGSGGGGTSGNQQVGGSGSASGGGGGHVSGGRGGGGRLGSSGFSSGGGGDDRDPNDAPHHLPSSHMHAHGGGSRGARRSSQQQQQAQHMGSDEGGDMGGLHGGLDEDVEVDIYDAGGGLWPGGSRDGGDGVVGGKDGQGGKGAGKNRKQKKVLTLSEFHQRVPAAASNSLGGVGVGVGGPQGSHVLGSGGGIHAPSGPSRGQERGGTSGSRPNMSGGPGSRQGSIDPNHQGPWGGPGGPLRGGPSGGGGGVGLPGHHQGQQHQPPPPRSPPPGSNGGFPPQALPSMGGGGLGGVGGMGYGKGGRMGGGQNVAIDFPDLSAGPGGAGGGTPMSGSNPPPPPPPPPGLGSGGGHGGHGGGGRFAPHGGGGGMGGPGPRFPPVGLGGHDGEGYGSWQSPNEGVQGSGQPHGHAHSSSSRDGGRRGGGNPGGERGGGGHHHHHHHHGPHSVPAHTHAGSQQTQQQHGGHGGSSAMQRSSSSSASSSASSSSATGSGNSSSSAANVQAQTPAPATVAAAMAAGLSREDASLMQAMLATTPAQPGRLLTEPETSTFDLHISEEQLVPGPKHADALKFMCPVCQGNLAYRPVMTRCGHYFCRECLDIWFGQHNSFAGGGEAGWAFKSFAEIAKKAGTQMASVKTAPCPSCMRNLMQDKDVRPLDERASHEPSRQAAERLLAVPIYCHHHPRCPWMGALADIERHMIVCPIQNNTPFPEPQMQQLRRIVAAQAQSANDAAAAAAAAVAPAGASTVSPARASSSRGKSGRADNVSQAPNATSAQAWRGGAAGASPASASKIPNGNSAASDPLGGSAAAAAGRDVAHSIVQELQGVMGGAGGILGVGDRDGIAGDGLHTGGKDFEDSLSSTVRYTGREWPSPGFSGGGGGLGLSQDPTLNSSHASVSMGNGWSEGGNLFRENGPSAPNIGGAGRGFDAEQDAGSTKRILPALPSMPRALLEKIPPAPSVPPTRSGVEGVRVPPLPPFAAPSADSLLNTTASPPSTVAQVGAAVSSSSSSAAPAGQIIPPGLSSIAAAAAAAAAASSTAAEPFAALTQGARGRQQSEGMGKAVGGDSRPREEGGGLLGWTFMGQDGFSGDLPLGLQALRSAETKATSSGGANAATPGSGSATGAGTEAKSGFGSGSGSGVGSSAVDGFDIWKRVDPGVGLSMGGGLFLGGGDGGIGGGSKPDKGILALWSEDKSAEEGKSGVGGKGSPGRGGAAGFSAAAMGSDDGGGSEVTGGAETRSPAALPGLGAGAGAVPRAPLSSSSLNPSQSGQTVDPSPSLNPAAAPFYPSMLSYGQQKTGGGNNAGSTQVQSNGATPQPLSPAPLPVANPHASALTPPAVGAGGGRFSVAASSAGASPLPSQQRQGVAGLHRTNSAASSQQMMGGGGLPSGAAGSELDGVAPPAGNSSTTFTLKDGVANAHIISSYLMEGETELLKYESKPRQIYQLSPGATEQLIGAGKGLVHINKGVNAFGRPIGMAGAIKGSAELRAEKEKETEKEKEQEQEGTANETEEGGAADVAPAHGEKDGTAPEGQGQGQAGAADEFLKDLEELMGFEEDEEGTGTDLSVGGSRFLMMFREQGRVENEKEKEKEEQKEPEREGGSNEKEKEKPAEDRGAVEESEGGESEDAGAPSIAGGDIQEGKSAEETEGKKNEKQQGGPSQGDQGGGGESGGDTRGQRGTIAAGGADEAAGLSGPLLSHGGGGGGGVCDSTTQSSSNQQNGSGGGDGGGHISSFPDGAEGGGADPQVRPSAGGHSREVRDEAEGGGTVCGWSSTEEEGGMKSADTVQKEKRPVPISVCLNAPVTAPPQKLSLLASLSLSRTSARQTLEAIAGTLSRAESAVGSALSQSLHPAHDLLSAQGENLRSLNAVLAEAYQSISRPTPAVFPEVPFQGNTTEGGVMSRGPFLEEGGVSLFSAEGRAVDLGSLSDSDTSALIGASLGDLVLRGEGLLDLVRRAVSALEEAREGLRLHTEMFSSVSVRPTQIRPPSAPFTPSPFPEGGEEGLPPAPHSIATGQREQTNGLWSGPSSPPAAEAGSEWTRTLTGVSTLSCSAITPTPEEVAGVGSVPIPIPFCQREAAEDLRVPSRFTTEVVPPMCASASACPVGIDDTKTWFAEGEEKDEEDQPDEEMMPPVPQAAVCEHAEGQGETGVSETRSHTQQLPPPPPQGVMRVPSTLLFGSDGSPEPERERETALSRALIHLHRQHQQQQQQQVVGSWEEEMAAADAPFAGLPSPQISGDTPPLHIFAPSLPPLNMSHSSQRQPSETETETDIDEDLGVQDPSAHQQERETHSTAHPFPPHRGNLLVIPTAEVESGNALPILESLPPLAQEEVGEREEEDDVRDPAVSPVSYLHLSP